MVVRERRRKNAEILVCKINEKCTECMACVKLLGCPALIVEDGKVEINETMCVACGLCVSVCPYGAIDYVRTD
jgi:TPP-dependent indolepyruvate ferredoxin oxidoreductase alpha subunit